jgi:hypothetical protein
MIQGRWAQSMIDTITCLWTTSDIHKPWHVLNWHARVPVKVVIERAFAASKTKPIPYEILLYLILKILKNVKVLVMSLNGGHYSNASSTFKIILLYYAFGRRGAVSLT